MEQAVAATAITTEAQQEQELRTVVVGPQPGPQTAFASSNAHIAVFGGSAGSGKTWAMLLEPLKYRKVPDFHAVIFRRTYPQIRSAGGMWTDADKLYRLFGATPKESTLEWTFPSGAKIKFAHMQREEDKHAWDGSQIPYIAFDQLESFTYPQFSYMLSRNRSMCDVVPHIRATCNPEADHWLRDFMDWWIGDDGFPRYDRSGVLRWFVMQDDIPDWADTKQELIDKHGKGTAPTSFTFIPGLITDNQILMKRNPEYYAKLQGLSKVDRGRLLHGNWNIKESAGEYFKREYFEVVDAAPAGGRMMRYWDRAATKAQQGKEAKASWTVGMLLQHHTSGLWYIRDVIRFQGSPHDVETAIVNTASQDGREIEIGIEGDPGQAGKAEANIHVKNLAGYKVKTYFVHESKGVRAKPVSAQAEAGNIKVIRAAWNEAFFREVVNFDGTSNCQADQVDTLSGGFFMLTEAKRAGVFNWD